VPKREKVEAFGRHRPKSPEEGAWLERSPQPASGRERSLPVRKKGLHKTKTATYFLTSQSLAKTGLGSMAGRGKNPTPVRDFYHVDKGEQGSTGKGKKRPSREGDLGERKRNNRDKRKEPGFSEPSTSGGKNRLPTSILPKCNRRSGEEKSGSGGKYLLRRHRRGKERGTGGKTAENADRGKRKEKRKGRGIGWQDRKMRGKGNNNTTRSACEPAGE